jgi:predicted RND superfamily exporter protein
MSFLEGFFEVVTGYSKVAIVAMLVLTVAVGAGAPQVEQSSSLDQFQTESEVSQKLDYIDQNFTIGGENTTTVQVILRGENVLTRESLLANLRFQRALRENETVNETLASENAMVGIANVVSIRAIVEGEVAELQRLAAQVQRLNATVQAERRALEANRTALQQRSDALNATAGALRGAMTDLRENPGAETRPAFDRVDANTPVNLTGSHFATFDAAVERLRAAENQSAAEAAYRLGTRGVLREEFDALEERAGALEARAADLQEQSERLQERAAALEAERADVEAAQSANLTAQMAQLESMNASAVESLVGRVLSGDGESSGAFGFMPSTPYYEPGATQADATMILITQTTEEASQVSGTASDRIVESQLAIQDVGERSGDGIEYLVFGGGVITEEINNSMTDSLLIVGPLALVFVLLALIVAYRDLLDILLGLLGIVSVLVWTFGFMGWTDIAFNQIFIAVPVLLIGLSIDYAIHIFMRHREERVESDGLGPRASMAVALSGVGIALVWVTATTVIGFLSNLISPVPPIREFGIVSSVGIVAALAVFGVLVPALKIELDELLEGFGLDREKRAFGQVLALGSTAARKSPYVVILLVVLLSAGGAYGATQVDTSFDQEDFLAEDPPGWMKDLPEPFRPNEYSAKANLEYVSDRFVREDSQAQILIEGRVARANALTRIDGAREAAAGKNVTQTLSTGEPDIESPLSVMQSVAARNATFNETFVAADGDGDGIPNRNVAGVYDALFAAAPQEAAGVIHRTEAGDYEAVRLVISVKGTASSDAITTEMREVADGLDGNGFEATATGTAILNKVVQDELLRTVIDSLIITLVAIFAFLMLIYRITQGSATLGAVTLLPVAFSVTWILGTMYLLDIPFNVITGLITSLTVGLGVAYSIHISERYNQELDRSGTVWEAMRTAVTGTGGALLGSAATTVGGFGTLAFAILPPLQQFGIITGMTIIYAFLAAVLVLPSLLVVWTRYAGPEWTKAMLTEEPSGKTPGPVDPAGQTDSADAGSDDFEEDGFVPATEYGSTEDD